MAQNPDPYMNFAAHYDRFEGAFDQHNQAEHAFFATLFKDKGTKTVLDCACGTGHHLHLCQQLGVSVTGSDISEAMLSQASTNLDGAGMSLPLHLVDYRSLPEHFPSCFDAVLCLRSSILHMPNPDEVLRAFTSMHTVLCLGGVLVLTQGTTDRQWLEKPRFLLAVNEPDLTRMFVIDYDGKGARYNIIDIQHTANETGMQVWSIEYPYMMLKDEQEQLLLEAGFANVQAYGSFEFEPYDKNSSNRLILVATKGN